MGEEKECVYPKEARSEGTEKEKECIYPKEARNEVLEKVKGKKLQEKSCNFLPLYLIPNEWSIVYNPIHRKQDLRKIQVHGRP